MRKATKKLLSFITAAAISASAFTALAVTAFAENALKVSYDGEIKISNETAAEVSGVMAIAKYDGGVLQSVKTEPVSVGETPLSTGKTLDEGDKVYIWSNLDGSGAMVPIADVYTYAESETTAEPTAEPTEEPTEAPTAEPTDEPLSAKVYIDETFDYEDQTIIASAGQSDTAAPDPVKLGDITYSAGRRNNGTIQDYIKISSNKLVANATSYAGSGRGTKFDFDGVDIPTVSDIADGYVLEMSFDVKTSGTFEVSGYGNLTAADLTTGAVKARIILDKDANAQYLIVTDTEGNVINSKVSALTASTFTGVSFRIGTAWVEMDNLKVQTKAKDTGILNISVTDGESAVDEASITIGSYSAVTASDGKISVALPNGSYTVTASKNGYEHTQGMGDNDVKSAVVNSDTQAMDFVLALRSYVKIPDTVTITGGQVFIAAPKDAAPSKTAAFTVDVLDQFEIPMTADEYTLEWSIYPAGTSAADDNVTIDENGVVSVLQAFHADNNTAAYDVTAVVATDDRNQKVTKTLMIGNNDIIYYEPIAWSVGRNGSRSLASAITLPEISSITINAVFNALGNDNTSNVNLALVTNGGNLVGVQLLKDNTLTAWTGWTGTKDMNQYNDVGAFANSALLIDNYSAGTAIDITFTVDKDTNSITVSAGDKAVSLPYTISANTLTGVRSGNYRLTTTSVTVTDVTIQEPDNNYLAITGDTDFAKISGQTIERTYELGQSVLVPDETFTWDIEGEHAGISIENGVLTVLDTAEPGNYTITAVSDINANKNASLNITIDGFQEMKELWLSGASAYNVGDEGDTYAVTKSVDKYGDEVKDLLPAVVWSSDNADVITIDEETGKSTVVGAGTANITAAITNGTAISEKSIPVTVSVFSITGDADGNSTVVDTSALVTDSAVEKYLVTTATADGVKVSSAEASAAEITDGSYTVDTTGADKYEIAPIYTYSTITLEKLGGYDAGFKISVPADTYNFTFVAWGERFDTYANDQMLVNNYLQGSSAVKTAKRNDIVIKEGYVNITGTDFGRGVGSSGLTSMTMYKSPSIVTRVPKIYLIGDSLVCTYYNGANASNNYQTGWGDALLNFTDGSYELVNLANSGATANGLVGSAFTQIDMSAKPGDIVIAESGYNDETYDTKDIMRAAVTLMVNKAKAAGADIILVSPNASAHDYKSGVKWAGIMSDVAADTGVPYIDLASLSYNFYYEKYGSNFGNVYTTYNVSDRLHSTYTGAQVCASLVAQSLKDMGYSFINADYGYTYTDGLGNTYTVQVE